MVAGIGYRDNSMHIVRPTGANRFEVLLDLCTRMYQQLNCSIVLKKIDQVLYEQLLTTQLFRTHSDNPYLFEEEAFPEHIVQLAHLFHTPPDAQHQSQAFLRKVKRFERSTRLHAVQHPSWEQLESNPGFQALFGHNLDKYHSYKQIIKEACTPYIDDGRYRTCAYYNEHNVIQGFYVSELLAPSIMGLYCAVSAKSSPGITEWMDYNFFQQLFHEGIQLLYLGGSETEGVHTYVQKLLPSLPPYVMRPLFRPWTGLTLD